MASNVTLNETAERNIASKPAPPQSRRRRASNAALSPPDRLKKRDIEFMHQTVSIVQKIGEFGSSYFYSARSDANRRRRNQLYLIKATVVATKDQAQRAEDEVRLLRRMRGSPGIPTIIDCGFSTIEERSFEYQTEGDHLDARRLYCVLIDPCPDFFLSEFIKRRRLKYKTKTSRSLFTMRKKSAIWNGYLPIDIILDIFGQMVSAVKALHSYHDEDSRETTGHTEECVNFEVEDYGRLHLDIQPSRFLIRKRKTRGFEKESYDVTLCSFGSSIVGNVKLTSEADKRIAGKLIESYSSQKYRSPEMIDLNLSMELTTSSDIWGLGCCFYELLFLKECYKGHGRLDQLRGVFLLPASHPYSTDTIELLSRMLTVDSMNRANVEEVQACLSCLKQRIPLPPPVIKYPPSLAPPSCMESLIGDLSERSSHRGGEVTEESRSGSHSRSYLKPVRSRYNLTDFRLDESLDVSGDGGGSSDGTEFSQWLEFKPGSSGGLNLEKRIAPLPGPTRVVKKGSMRRRRRFNDPLSLGAAPIPLGKSEDKKQSQSSPQNLGLIYQLSSRSLNPIDASKSEGGSGSGSGCRERDQGSMPNIKPSINKITPFNSKIIPGSGRQNKKGELLSSSHSLHVSDLMKSSRTSNVPTSQSSYTSSSLDLFSSDVHSSRSGQITSSEWHSSTGSRFTNDVAYSSTELMTSSSDFGLSSSRTITPMTDTSSRKLISLHAYHPDSSGNRSFFSSSDIDTPQSAPVRIGSSYRSSVQLDKASPSLLMAPFYHPRKEAENLSTNAEEQVFSDTMQTQVAKNEILHNSDSYIVTKKKKKSSGVKSKDKKKKKSKSKSKKKQEEEVNGSDPVQSGGNLMDIQKQDLTMNPKSTHRLSTGSWAFSLPDFQNSKVEIVKSKKASKISDVVVIENLDFSSTQTYDDWGSFPSIAMWTEAQEKNRGKDKKKHKMIVKARSEPGLTLFPMGNDRSGSNTRSSSASALNPKDLRTENFRTPAIRHDSKPKRKNIVKSTSETNVFSLKKDMTESLTNPSTKRQESSWRSPSIVKEPISFIDVAVDEAGFPTPPLHRSNKSSDIERMASSSRMEGKPNHHQMNPRDSRVAYIHGLKTQQAMESARMTKSASSASERFSRVSSDQSSALIHNHQQHILREGKITRSRSASTIRSNRSSLIERPASVDTNLPPGDEAVVAEISVPFPKSKSTNIKDDVQKALTAGGREKKNVVNKSVLSKPFPPADGRLIDSAKEGKSTRSGVKGSADRVKSSKYSEGKKVPSFIELVAHVDDSREKHDEKQEKNMATVVAHTSSTHLSFDSDFRQIHDNAENVKDHHGREKKGKKKKKRKHGSQH